MPKANTVSVIGGSMAGLFAAISLAKRGFNVHIYERASEALANRGAGIATHNELYNAVRDAGVELRDEMGVHSSGRIMFDLHGTAIAQHEMAQTMTSWGLLYRFLRAQITDTAYHNGYALNDIRQDAEQIVACFDNGEQVVSDWLVAADGARSSVRAIVEPQNTLNYCGYYGWRGLIDERLIASDILHQIDHRIAFGMAPGGHWLGYLVAGPDDKINAGQRWYNWGWYRTANDLALRDHLTDSSGTHYEDGIPHNLIRPELIQTMRDDAQQHLAPQICEVIRATERPFIQGMYDVGCKKMRYDRVCLIGDAAFTARPHVGLGVSKAAEDASKLAGALAAGDHARALDVWESERLKFGHAVVQWGRDLGSYIGPPPADDATREKAQYYQRPEVLVEVTAAIDPYRLLNLA